MANDSNTKGDEAEAAVLILLNNRISGTFRVRSLSGKWPTIDFYVEIIGKTGYFFFIQVKSSTQGYVTIGGRKQKFKVTVKKAGVERLIKYYGPTYVIGLDYVKNNIFKSQSYIVAVTESDKSAISRIPVSNKLTPKNLGLLKQEVIDYWNSSNARGNKSTHLTKFER